MEQTQEYLEELDLPDLEGQVTVEMVVQKVSQEEEEETENEENENENESEEGSDTRKVTIQLNPTSAPVTAGNFVDLVEQNFYDALAFHRFVDEFVVQGGDPQSRDPEFEIEDLGSGSYVDPLTEAPREIPLEIKIADTEEIVYNQIVDESLELSHEAGVIAMARSQELDTASSQFYFTLDDVSNQLDGGYSVFGEVTDGFDFVQEIGEGDRILLARVIDGIVSSRVSEIVADSKLLNEFANKDNAQKVSYVLSMEENEEDTDNSDGDDAESNQDDSDSSIEESIVEEITSSQLSETVDEAVSEAEEEDDGTDENSDTDEEEEEDEQQEQTDENLETNEEDETGSAIEEGEDETDQTTSETEGDDILDIDTVDSTSFTMMGSEGDDEISGSEDNDIISGRQGDDSLDGLEGNDWLRGGKGDDVLTGGIGNDYLVGDYGVDILTGGEGTDSFLLRADTVEGIDEIDQADMITDFSVTDSDGIIVIAEFTTSDGLEYEFVDGDTIIKLSDSGHILGVVTETSIEDVENNIFAVNPDDYALRLG